MCDLLGKGVSTPRTSKTLNHSQYDIINEDIPSYLQFIRNEVGQQSINLGAHSWGGVLLYAYLARFNDQKINSIVSFGTKRRIAIKGFRRFINVDVGWDWYGEYLVKKHGYLPAKAMRMGTEDEPGPYYLETKKWVAEKNWISPVDKFDYSILNKMDLPPSLFLTGSNDKTLGHPEDVKRLASEMGLNISEVFQEVGTNHGFRNNYDHINILTHKDSVGDHFPLVLDFLDKHQH